MHNCLPAVFVLCAKTHIRVTPEQLYHHFTRNLGGESYIWDHRDTNYVCVDTTGHRKTLVI